MKRRTNLINNILSLGITFLALFVCVYFCNNRYGINIVKAMSIFAVGAIIAGIFNTFVHELGHMIAGKKNGFEFSSMSVWFFKWTKIKGRIHFNFVMMGDETGYTEMIPKYSENIEKRYKNMIVGAFYASFFAMLIGIPPLFLVNLPVWVYGIWSMFLPVGAYFYFASALPMSTCGIRNDGGVVYGINKKDDQTAVLMSILSIQAQMYQGKTPSEVDEKLYFELPQLPEDDPLFAVLLNSRYNYYLDKCDFENAKAATARLLTLEDYVPKYYKNVFKTDALYNACTFDFNEELADDYTYELEKYLNNVNTATNVRAKLAYLLNVKGEKDAFELFYKKGLKEADRCQIKGQGAFEKKLFERLKESIE